jgi:DNA oxidative demethylase
MRGIIEPTGLRSISSLLSEDQDGDLFERVRGLQFDEVRMHGQVARRVVRHLGLIRVRVGGHYSWSTDPRLAD